MNINGPIIIIENDIDEAILLEEIINEVAPDNPVEIIHDSTAAIKKLTDCEKPFLILSSINLSAINGFQLRDSILSDAVLARKCNPYIFYAAHSNQEMLLKVYDRHASGYFHDINDFNELKEKLRSIIEYWKQNGC